MNELAVTVPTSLQAFSGGSGQRRMLALANEFKVMVAQKAKAGGKKWVVQIGPGNHATIEAWQYLGQRAGVCARTTETRELRNPVTGEFEGYLAVAEIQRLDTGDIIGRSEQVCMADETLKRKDGTFYRRWESDDGLISRHAVLGMAQTRAQSRALASVLRFLAEMAGLEGTPAEDMDGVRKENLRPRQQAREPIASPKSKSGRPPPGPPQEAPPAGAPQEAPPAGAPDLDPGDDIDFEEPLARPNLDGCEQMVGTVEDVGSKSGTGKKGKWTRYFVKMSGKFFGTFDTKLGTRAEAFKGLPAVVFYAEDGDFNNLKWIEEAL